MRVRGLFLALSCLVAFSLHAESPLIESSPSYRRFTTADGLPQMQVETIWQDSRGYIYIGTLSGFARYDGLEIKPFLGGRQENIVAFREVDGRVRAMGFVRQWLVSGDKVAKSPVDPDGQLFLNNLNAADLPSGLVLLEDRMEQGRVLCRMTPEGMERLLESSVLDEMTPDRKMFVDSALIYIPTPRGLFVSENGSVRLLDGKTDVFSLARLPEGLAALVADGIYRVEDDGLSPLLEFRFEDPDYGLSARTDDSGRLLIAASHTIWRYDAASPEPIRKIAGGINLIKGLFVDSWGRLWAATYQGAYCFFHCNFVKHCLADENDIVRALACCDGHMVMGTLNGGVLFDGTLVGRQPGGFFSPGAATIGDTVYLAGDGDVASVCDGTLRWLGLPGGICRFVSRFSDRLAVATDNGLLAWDPASGRLDTLALGIRRPWCAADDGRGGLWMSGNPGLYHLTLSEDGTPSVRKVVETPSVPVITAMASDGNGNVCYALGDSLFHVRTGGPDSVSADRPHAMKEVLPVLSGHAIRSLHISPKGFLVVAAVDGLLVARLDPDFHAGDIGWFGHDDGFTVIEPQLGGMAEEADGTVWLAGLEDMISFNPSNLLSDNRLPAVVKKPRPWWKRWWAWLPAALLLASCLWLAARRFERRLSRGKIERLEREKKQKELQLRAVRLKAIPHFHSNVISSIEYFVINKSPDEASRYLKLYSDFTNKTLSDIDRPSRTVAEEVEYVKEYLELEQLRYGERLRYSITISSDVDRNTLLPTMLLHTYCENAVKHGISSKAGTGNVEVSIVRKSLDGTDGVLVSVKDDGIGRTEAARIGSPSTGQGLKILGRQIDLCNQTNVHKIVHRVIDLADDAGRPLGTCFETWVPADYKY